MRNHSRWVWEILSILKIIFKKNETVSEYCENSPAYTNFSLNSCAFISLPFLFLLHLENSSPGFFECKKDRLFTKQSFALKSV